MNLAFIGFSVAGVIFAVYAYTFYSLAGAKLPVFLKNYAFAYFSLALAFLIWAFAALNNSFLVNSVIIGNILLLLGSIFLLKVLFNNSKNTKILSIFLGVILSLIFLWVRINYYQPTPFMLNGILIFNTQRIVAEILGLIFAFVWLPANLLVAKKVSATTGIQGMSFVYSFIYILSTVSAILFISVSTVSMVIASFVTLSLCFVMLIYSNYVINKISSEDIRKNVPKKPAGATASRQ